MNLGFTSQRLSSNSASGRALPLVVLFIIACCCVPLSAQTLDQQRAMGSIMLDTLKSDIKKNYYDPTFRGADLDARFAEANAEMKKAASYDGVLLVIAQTMMAFDDSHTYFTPPRSVTRVEHGWQMQMIGGNCYIVAVQPGSDAEAKNLRPGDQVLSVEGQKPTRGNFWKLQYLLYTIAPRAGMRLKIEKPDGMQQELEIKGRVHEGRKIIDLQAGMSSDRNDLIREAEVLARLYSHRYYEIGAEVMVWNMPQFDLEPRQIDELMDKARKHKALILDLRGNSGGSESTMLRLIGNCFDRDVKVGDLKRRTETKPVTAKTRGGGNVFNGQLIVLIDHESGSAAEVFARVVQVEKRGKVIGDVSAGAVMRARHYEHQLGNNLIFYYGASITDSDLIMADSKSLERVGVKPDEIIGPSSADLAAGRDPVLARAGELVGWRVTPEKAGAMLPVQWRK